MAVIVSVQVYRSQIAQDYQVGGQGYRWLDQVKRAMFQASLANCPVRTGELLSGHRSEIRGLNQYSCIGTVYNIAYHSEWVHEGTKGPIVAKRSTFMFIPAGNGYPRIKARKVRGQSANPWIDEACTSIAMGYGAFPAG